MTDQVLTLHNITVTANNAAAAACGTALDAAVTARLLTLTNTPPVGLTGAVKVGTFTYYFDGTVYQGYAVISYTTAATA